MSSDDNSLYSDSSSDSDDENDIRGFTNEIRNDEQYGNMFDTLVRGQRIILRRQNRNEDLASDIIADHLLYDGWRTRQNRHTRILFEEAVDIRTTLNSILRTNFRLTVQDRTEIQNIVNMLTNWISNNDEHNNSDQENYSGDDENDNDIDDDNSPPPVPYNRDGGRKRKTRKTRRSKKTRKTRKSKKTRKTRKSKKRRRR